MKYPTIAALVLIAGAAMTPACFGAGGEGTEARSAQKFVQDFYVWYLKEEKKEHKEDLSTFAFKTKPQWFSDALIQGLKEDEAAQAKDPGEVVGLDFDPFLNAQDVCEPYKTG